MSRGNRAGLTVLIVLLLAAIAVGIVVRERGDSPVPADAVNAANDTLTVREMVMAAPDTSTAPARKSERRRKARPRDAAKPSPTVTRSPLDEVIEQK